MPFTTFRAESKAYMGYDARDIWGRLRFWLYYPIAAAIFYWWKWRNDLET